MRIGVPTETAEGEKRVALTPDCVKILAEKGFEVVVQAGAGARAGYNDPDYEGAGATVSPDRQGAHQADLVARVIGPTDSETIDEGLAGSMLLAFQFPASNPKTTEALCKAGVTSFAMELIPRITRAQSMDALSSMSTIAGYKGALMAANYLPKFFPMLMTAAGTLPPARVFVIGAGVAGLQAIATAKRLGAIVEAFDVRPAVKEQVESLGARFAQMPVALDDAEDASGYAKEVSADTHAKELEFIGGRIAKCDVVITTALIPGKPAPTLVTRQMLKGMSNGSVIVDLAAPNGGNCEATVPGENVVVEGVTVLGPKNILSEMAYDASRMYSKNVTEFLLNLAPDGKLNLDLEDQIIRETLVTYEGQIYHAPTRVLLEKTP